MSYRHNIQNTRSLVFLLTWIASFSVNSAPISCLNGFVENGAVDNLSAKTTCIVTKNESYVWNAHNGTEFVDFNVKAKSNDSHINVTAAIGFLTDYGFSDPTSEKSTFYDNKGQMVGILSLLGKSDNGYGTVGSGQSGTWTIPDNPTFMTVKSSTSFVLYYLPDTEKTGFWSTAGIENKNGQTKNLSHISFWDVESYNGGFGISSCGSNCTDIPEPKTLLIFSLGFLVTTFIRKRFNKSR